MSTPRDPRDGPSAGQRLKRYLKECSEAASAEEHQPPTPEPAAAATQHSCTPAGEDSGCIGVGLAFVGMAQGEIEFCVSIGERTAHCFVSREMWEAFFEAAGWTPQPAPGLQQMGKQVTAKRKIVCLCGSTRFKKEFEETAREETLAGRVVLTVHCFHHADNIELTDEQERVLLALHMDKIAMADEVLVLNIGGYVGEHLKAELAYAKRLGTPLRWMKGAD